MYLGEKELVIICDHGHFSSKNVWLNELKTSSRLLKGQSRGKTRVTLIQGMNGQREDSLSINCLWF